MSISLEIPDISSDRYSIQAVTFTTSKVLQKMDRLEEDNSIPIRRSKRVYQIDRDGYIFVLQDSTKFKIINNNGEEDRTKIIAEVVSDVLKAVKSKITKERSYRDLQLQKYGSGINNLTFRKIAHSITKPKHKNNHNHA
jgi:c-di-AMP phosphodiesterase-like protein